MRQARVPTDVCEQSLGFGRVTAAAQRPLGGGTGALLLRVPLDVQRGEQAEILRVVSG